MWVCVWLMQVLVEFWLNQYNYDGNQGDLLAQAQVRRVSTCNDASIYLSSMYVDAKSRAAYASACPAETGSLLQ